MNHDKDTSVLTVYKIIKAFLESEDKHSLLQKAHEYNLDSSIEKSKGAKCILFFATLWVSFEVDEILRKAGYLTYNAICSIVPMMAIVFTMPRGFNKEIEIWTQLKRLVGDNGILLDKIWQYVEKSIQLTNNKSGYFFVLAVAISMYTSNNAFCTLQDTFNDIWGVKNKKGSLERLPKNMFILFMIPIVITLLECITGGIESVVFFENSYTIAVVRFIFVFISLTCMYYFIPYTTVKLKYAIIAAFLTSTLIVFWHIICIEMYGKVFTFDIVYGSFAAIMLFIFWINIIWVLCLVGIKTNQLLQEKEYKQKNQSGASKNIYNQFQILLLVTSCCSKRFNKGEDITIDAIANDTQLLTKHVSFALNYLEEKGIMQGINSGRKKTYLPHFPIEQYSVSDFINKICEKDKDDIIIHSENVINIAEDSLMRIVTNNDTLLTNL